MNESRNARIYRAVAREMKEAELSVLVNVRPGARMSPAQVNLLERERHAARMRAKRMIESLATGRRLPKSLERKIEGA